MSLRACKGARFLCCARILDYQLNEPMGRLVFVLTCAALCWPSFQTVPLKVYIDSYLTTLKQQLITTSCNGKRADCYDVYG